MLSSIWLATIPVEKNHMDCCRKLLALSIQPAPRSVETPHCPHC